MKKLLLMIAACAFVSIGFCQNYQIDANKVIPPSPTAAGLGKFGEFGNNGLATGTVNVSVPIYNVAHHDVNFPISLSYNGGGARPSDIPGWVGLGWNLNAGGVITRVVNDIPDDVITPDIGYYHGRSFLAGITTTFPNFSTIEDNIARHRDFRPDKFVFNINGEGGKFFFDLDGNPVLEGQKKYKIEFDISHWDNHGMVEFFDVFYITTEDGTKYEFSAKEWTQYGMNEEIPKFYVSSWYLTKIISPKYNEVTLTYSSSGNKFRYRESNFEKIVLGNIQLTYNHPISQSETISSRTKHETIYLKTIIFGAGKIEFKTSVRNDLRFQPTYSTDVADESKLDSIIVSYNDKVLKKFALGYLEPALGRLKLASLVESDEQNNPLAPHLFEYNPTEFPTFGLSTSDNYNSNSVDIWGYYNGKYNGGTKLPITQLGNGNYAGNAIRTVDPVYAQAEILTKITYPTGGYSKFTYEANDYSKVGENQINGFEYDWSETLHFIYDGSGFTEWENPHLTEFVLSEESVVQTRGICDSTGPDREWCGTVTEQPLNRKLPAGRYTLAEIFNTDALLSPQNNDIGLASGFLRYRYAKPVHKKLGGGVRISKIENFDGVDKLTEKKFEYKDLLDPNKSSGVLAKEPIFIRNLEDFWGVASGFCIQSEPLESMPDGPGLIYSNVREKFSDGGFIDHFYTTYEDFYDLESTSNIPNEYRMSGYTSRAYKRGLEHLTETYNNTGILVKSQKNDFTEYTSTSKDITKFEVNTLIRTVIHGEPEATQNGWKMFGGDKRFVAYVIGRTTIPSRFYVKTKEITTDYYQGGATNISEKNFIYGTNHLQLSSISESRSDGGINKTYFKYPYDYNVVYSTPSSQGILALQSKNIANKIVEQYTELFNSSSVSKGYVNGLYNQFNSNGLLASVFSFKNELPLSSFTPSHVNGDQIILDPAAYVERLRIDKYDLKGNIITQQKTNGVLSSYKWGYESRYPIVEAVNASDQEFYVEGFEEHTGAIVGTAYSGNKYFNGSFTVNWTVPNAKAYLISYYYLDGGVWKMKTETYSSPSHTLSGGTAYDDIKVHPADAQISMRTYKPLVGMQSVSDVAGRSSFYDYDSFGRLVNLRDHGRHIVKNYEYRYRNNLATPVYYNTEKKVKLYRNNCPSEAIVGYVWYVVPANKYSASSQIAADALANAEIASNGQSYANQAAGCVTLLPILVSTEAIDGSGYVSRVKVYRQGNLVYDYDPSAEEHSLTPGTYTFEVTVEGNLYSDIYGTGYGALRLEGDGIDLQCQLHSNAGTTNIYSFSTSIEAGTYVALTVVAGVCP